jgi:hypothetical protein
MTSTWPVGGYKCGCGSWVPSGTVHQCNNNLQYTIPVYTFSYVDLTALIKSIDELKDVVKELRNIIEKQQ